MLLTKCCSLAGSLSVVSNTTDNSTKKPTDCMEQGDASSLPEYGLRPIDVWKNNQDTNATPYPATDSPIEDGKVCLTKTLHLISLE